jgi:hypothetical protein
MAPLARVTLRCGAFILDVRFTVSKRKMRSSLISVLERAIMRSMFSRKTILAATDLLPHFSHAALTRFLLGYGLDRLPGGSLRDRSNAVAVHLLRNPEAVDDEGNNLSDAISLHEW